MRRFAIVLALAAAFFSPTGAVAQSAKPSETLQITANAATTWQQRGENVILLTGPVEIRTDNGQFSADNAVVWLVPVKGGLVGEQQAQISLIGNARLLHGQARREGDKLFVAENVRGRITLTAEQRSVTNAAATPLYRQALEVRPAPGALPMTNPWTDLPVSPEAPLPAPTTQPLRRTQPVNFQSGEIRQTLSADEKIAYVLTGGVLLTQPKLTGEQLELRADRAVIFTQLKSLDELQKPGKFKTAQDAVYAAYLEGDVQIIQTPRPGERGKSDQRLYGQRVYYEFTTDRAVLTDAVIHTIDPESQIPITVRAEKIRQLSIGEYRAEKVQLTTSSFKTPSYSINASKAYVRQYETGDARYGQRTEFKGSNATLNLFGLPIFYWPYVSGALTERGAPLRGVAIGNSRNKGFSVETEWGLFESLGLLPPQGLDASVNIDGYGERGVGLGLNASYEGGYIRETTREPWDFSGSFQSYILPHDTGEDKLGRDRRRIDEGGPDGHDAFRGFVLWEHQHFFPQDWQAQLRGAWVSDPTFLEFWRPKIFDNGLPSDLSAYLKRQRDTEALTLLLQIQPNDIVTTADALQETTAGLGPVDAGTAKPFEVEHLPELGYYRVGDSFLDDSLTFFSANTLSGLRMNAGDDTLFDYGFRNASSTRPAILPGIPSQGQTGFTDDWVYRGDFRQEIDWPIQAGQFKMTPFVVGRYTAYSDSVDGNSLNRLYAGAGARITTAFWKVDDSFKSEFFDLHRLRHVIEPGVNVFTSVVNEDREDVYIFDEQIDDIKDISAVQLVLNQRWQTKRGGPGNWRSVDFFALNIDASFYSNAPDDDDLPPSGFRGLYFSSLPENSIPRNSLNAEALWRISDNTVILSDYSQNLEEMQTATAALGFAVQRDAHLSYYTGVRYIGQVNSTIGSFMLNYQLSTKYSFAFLQSYEFSERESNQTSFTVTRKFDRFYFLFEVYHDNIDDESGIRFGLFPEGFAYGITGGQFNSLFGQGN